MSRQVTCTNHNGVSIVFRDDGFTPFLLAHIDGIYSTDNIVSVTQNSTIDGGTYQGSVKKVRNIVMTVLDAPANVFNQQNRDLIYVLFEKGSLGTLYFTENNSTRMIDYYVESVERSNVGTKAIVISLVCPDPYFYDINEVVVDMANWVEAFEFEHDFLSVGESLGERSTVSIVNIMNDSAANDIGMTITLETTGDVTNPSVTKVQGNKTLKVGRQSLPFVLHDNDVLTITTGTGNKHVYLTSNGATSEINGYITEDSEFIQITRGENTIGFAADAGQSNLTVHIQYRLKYEGV